MEQEISRSLAGPGAMSSIAVLAGVLTVGLAVVPTRALAQDGQVARGESRWGLGVAADIRQQPYRAAGNETLGIPLIYYENYWVRVVGPSIDLKLPSVGPVAFSLKAAYGAEGYEASDSPYLLGMAEREGSFWIGADATWRTPFANISAELMGDASGHSEGRRFKLQVDRRFSYGKFGFTPRLAAIHLDGAYVDYYYGVNAGEVMAGRPAYTGESTTNVEAGLRADYSLTPKQNIFLDLRRTSLGSAIKDSPLVDRSSQFGVRVGYLYRF